jgi:predicted 3-demethylubiquinone-9 3-methyltransferase (glyoxalase superfamily)
MTASIVIEGQELVALNGGPIFTFTPAISFVVNCRTQAEFDRLWVRCPTAGSPDNAAG